MIRSGSSQNNAISEKEAGEGSLARGRKGGKEGKKCGQKIEILHESMRESAEKRLMPKQKRSAAAAV